MKKKFGVFKEVQKFTQWWLWLILIGVAACSVFYIIKPYFIDESVEFSIGKIIASLIVVFGLILFFIVLRLTTIITSQNVLIHFYPFVKKKIDWDDIKSAKIIKYDFVGGWGIRFFTKYGTVYNIKGNIGLQLELINGEKYLIGTQQEVELAICLKDLKDKVKSQFYELDALS